jgi:hypothetical protein
MLDLMTRNIIQHKQRLMQYVSATEDGKYLLVPEV